jgi:hypothetical protein
MLASFVFFLLAVVAFGTAAGGLLQVTLAWLGVK